jgi:hypothetical protein
VCFALALHTSWFGYYKQSTTKKLIVMKKNVGNADRVIRVILAAIFAVLYFTGTVTGTIGLVLVILGGVFALTSVISFCPLYALVGLNTCPVKKA